jgi:ribonuclease I
MTEVQRINGRGFARGWHATELQRKATAAGQSMAEYFAAEIALASAFNVPAEATVIKGGRVHYRFIDGSVTSFRHVKRRTN